MPIIPNFLKTSKKELIVFGMLGIAILAALIMMTRHTLHQNHDGLKINLAGRQRMLSQKLAKELLLYREDQISPDEVRNTIEVFDTTLMALTNGGTAPLNLSRSEFRTLPPMDVAKTKEVLLSVISLWTDLKTNALIFLNEPESNDKYLAIFIKENNQFLDLIDQAVVLMQKTSESNNLKSQVYIYASVLLIIIFLSIFLFQKMVKLSEASRHIEELERFLPICSHCKKIRTDEKNPMDNSSWIDLEAYFKQNEEINFSHGICPSCATELYPNFFESKE